MGDLVPYHPDDGVEGECPAEAARLDAGIIT